MATRKIKFANDEFYHIFNRGTDKRDIFLDQEDYDRFFQSLSHFNTLDPIGSIYEQSFKKIEDKQKIPQHKLVNYVAYALNPNHFHLLLQQKTEKGIKKLMHRLGTGFATYFNKRHHRKGSLFQGKFGAKHVDSNEYLLHLSVYINLNHRAHQLGGKASKLVRTSWEEYQNNSRGFLCQTSIILEQFKRASDYETFAMETLKIILDNKRRQKEMEDKDDDFVFNLAEPPPLGGLASKWGKL